MASASEHRKKANHNQEFLATIDVARFPDWVVTVCFYKALHLAEMAFARLSVNKQHSSSHRERHDALKRSYPYLWKHYLPLYTQSRRARYKVSSINRQTVEYVQGRLAKVEEVVAKLCP